MIDKLLQLKKKHDFILFEDRKFADIGSTVAKQYSKGIYEISRWSDIVTVHALPGDGILAGLKAQLGVGDDRGCLLLAEMSSEGHLLSTRYQQSVISMAKRNMDFVVGFIAGKRVDEAPDFLVFTPGMCYIVAIMQHLKQVLTMYRSILRS